MMKYRKKPVIVDAIQFLGQGSYDEMKKEWPEFGDKSQYAHCQMADINEIVINTKKGYLTVFIGDYVVRNDEGEFYPCKPDMFEEIYEHTGSDD